MAVDFRSDWLHITNAVRYWQSVYGTLRSFPDRATAYAMARVVECEHFDSWYDPLGRQYDPNFAALFDIIAHLETPDGSHQRRAQEWQQVAKLLAELEDRYLGAPR